MVQRRSRSESLSPSARIARMRSEVNLPAPLAEPSGSGQDLSQGRDRFSRFDANPVKITAEEAVSTFSIDVDTAAYGFTRAALQNGVLPQRDAVRTEELDQLLPLRLPAPRQPRDALRGPTSP